MHAFLVSVAQILAIGRNPSIEHGRILGVCGKLSLTELGQRFGATGKEPRKDGGTRQSQRNQQRRSNTAPMPANKFAGTISDRIRPSANGLVSQVSLQVVSKGLDRRVALPRILLQRLR